ncbi:hypothetical protein JW766_05130 [Candidatus Dojkabacteria bacterium]|nr:hypothetical protein [Candidatus Dojkabacteria bacterium]
MTDTHPELQAARERGLPEVLLPDGVVNWFEGQDSYIDDLSLLRLAGRYSPMAVRAIVLACAVGVHTEKGFFPPLSRQFSWNAAFYGYFNDFLTWEEFQILSVGKAIHGHLPKESQDLWAGPFGRRIPGRVVPTIEEAALMVQGIRRENPSKKVIFKHGKWNGIPHAGHMLALRNSISLINLDEEVDHDDMILVVSCDTNFAIREFGYRPFLDTVSRMSLISYLPWVDITCSSGDFPRGEPARLHWVHKYRTLRPDFVVLEIDDPLFDEKKARTEEIGGKVIVDYRESVYGPRGLNDPTMERLHQNEISSSNLVAGTVGEWCLSNAYAHAFTIKQIREEMYGIRNWFS